MIMIIMITIILNIKKPMCFRLSLLQRFLSQAACNKSNHVGALQVTCYDDIIALCSSSIAIQYD